MVLVITQHAYHLVDEQADKRAGSREVRGGHGEVEAHRPLVMEQVEHGEVAGDRVRGDDLVAEEAEAAAEFAREARATLVHVSLREDRLRLLHAGRWQNLSDGSASPERIRSAVAAGIYLRGVRA